MGGLITRTSTFKTDINISILMNQTGNIWQVYYMLLLSYLSKRAICSVCPSAPVLCCESVKDVEAFTEPSSANSCPVFHFLVLLTCLCSLSFVLAFIQQCISLSSLFLHPPLPPYTISPVGAAQLVLSKKRLIFSEAITKLQCSSGPVYVCMCSLYIFFC